MPNPKGNPESLEPHKFKPGGDESLTERLNIRIPKSLNERLRKLDDKAQFCRDAIKKALDELDNKTS